MMTSRTIWTLRIVFLAACAFIGWILVQQAVAQMMGTATLPMRCFDRSSVMRILKDINGEVPAGRGVSSNGVVVELFLSPAGGFTVTMEQPGQLTCIVGGGIGWKQKPPGRDAELLTPRHRALAFGSGE